MAHRLSKITTRTGDSGETGLGDGSRLPKDSARVQALGDVDELNSALGVLLAEEVPEDIREALGRVQQDLFDLGGELSIPGHAMLNAQRIAELEKLQLLRAHGVERLSIGVQSFLEAETKAAGRPQKTSTVEQALETIRRVDFPTLNIDLIYGLPGQTVASWLQSLESALRYEPEELYLYPLYVRPLTGLGRRASAQKSEHDVRLACYRAGRELLLARGYTQISMRMFRATRVHEQTGPVYCAQEDGMVGLGCGARSYTSACQYASEYAVSARGVRTILQEYIAQPAEAFIYARYGFFLDEEEQRRRSVITALFDTGGIDPAFYRRRFDSEILADFPAFQELLERELIASRDGRFVLTEAGLERSDVIGPWLYSQQVQALMEGYQLQ